MALSRRSQMRTPSVASLMTLVCAVVAIELTIVPTEAQSQAGRARTTTKAAAWKAPRTPWGDPDLQGNYTNVYENGTPLERSHQFAGRQLADVQGEELLKIKEAVQRRTIFAFE